MISEWNELEGEVNFLRVVSFEEREKIRGKEKMSEEAAKKGGKLVGVVRTSEKADKFR